MALNRFSSGKMLALFVVERHQQGEEKKRHHLHIPNGMELVVVEETEAGNGPRVIVSFRARVP